MPIQPTAPPAAAPATEGPAASEKKKSDKKRKKSKKIASSLVEDTVQEQTWEASSEKVLPRNEASELTGKEVSSSAKVESTPQPKVHMGVSRSHKKILLDYQAARSKAPDTLNIGDAELEQLNNAKVYFIEQNWEVAIDKLTVIIEAHPTWADPWIYMMDCFFELKDWERCIELAEELTCFHPDNVSAPCYQATALKELNRTAEAIFVCNQAIELFPSSYFLYTIKGDCLFKENKYKLANEAYNRALKVEKFIEGTQKAVARNVVPWARLKWRAQI